MRTVLLAVAAAAVLAATPLRAQDKKAARRADRRPRSQPSGEAQGAASLRRSRRLRDPVRERRLPPADPRLRPVRRPLLPERPGPGRRHLPAPARAAHRAGHPGQVLRVQPHARLRGGHHVLQDASWTCNYSPKARVRVGKFKAPVGLERLQSATDLAFVERAFPSALVPNRDVGVQLHGELAGGVLAYAAGVFNGAPDGGQRRHRHERRQGPGRPHLHLALQAREVRPQGPGLRHRRDDREADGAAPRLPLRRPGQHHHASWPGITADGTRTRYVAAALFYAGPFGLLAEYAHSESRVKKADGAHVRPRGRAPGRPRPRSLLTGDTASYTGVRAKKPFDPGEGPVGRRRAGRAASTASSSATQTLADGLIDPAKSAREAFAWALGVNWYLNRNIKQVVDFERTSFTGGAAGGADRPTENAIFIRTQVVVLSRRGTSRCMPILDSSFAAPAALGRLARRRRRAAAQELLNVSYDPTRELYQDFNAAFAEALEGEDRRRRHRQAVARRLGQAGPRGDRRAGGRRGHAGAGLRHRRARREAGLLADGLAEAPAAQQRALHLDHRLPGAQGQPQGHQGLGRPGQAGRRGHHAQPEDLRRRALELPRGLGLRARSSPAATRPRRKDFVDAALQERAGARLRRARLDHHLRRSAASATCCWPGRTRPSWRSRSWARTSSRSSCRRVSILAEPPVDGGRQGRRQAAARARWPQAYLEYLYTPEGQEIAAKHYYRPRRRRWPQKYAGDVPEGQPVHHRRGVRRLAEGAEDALRRRRRLRPDLPAASSEAWRRDGSPSRRSDGVAVRA